MFTYPITLWNPADWFTADDPVTDAQHTGGYGTYTIRNIMAADTATKGGSKIRVTFRSGATSGGFEVANVYIGHAASSGDSYDFESTPTELTFDTGSSGFSITTTDTTKVSDEVAFSFDKSKALIIAFYMNTGTYDDPACDTVNSNWTCWYKLADDDDTVNATGYSEQTDGKDCVGIDLVEIFG